jgi:RAD51-like protein 1
MKDESTLTHIPTSLSLLDAHMRGGIRLGSITEVVGHAGAGKTQFAMQLAVNAARFRKGSIYIDTEQKLNLPRLRAIAAKRNQQQSIQQHPSESATTNENINNETPYINEQQVLANVTVHAPHSTEELLSVLSSVEDEIVARNCPSPEDINTINRFPVSVLILDSIAAPARRDFGSGSAPQRAAAVIQSAQILKRLADQWNLCILVINQVGTTADSNHDNKLSAGIGEDIARGATAALGTSWHHCVSTRIHLKQEPATDHDHHSHRTDQQTSPPLVRRRCSIVKSNVVGSAEFAFAVSDLGIVDV